MRRLRNISQTEWLEGMKHAPIWLLGVIVLLHILFVMVVNLVIFGNGYLSGIATATGGWINETLMVNLIGLVVEVGLVLLIIGHMKLRDVGIRKEDLAGGLIGTFLCWVVIHLAELAIFWLFPNGFAFNQRLFSDPSVILGGFIGQLFGNALLEEILFRGFLLTQVALLLQKRKNQGRRMTYAVLISQLVFVLIHIPNRIYAGYSGGEFLFDFVQLYIIAILFSVVYLQTRNLFLVIGIHALINNAPMIMIGPLTPIIGLICLLLFVAIFPFIKKRRRSRQLAV